MFRIEEPHRFPLNNNGPEIMLSDATPIQLAMSSGKLVPKPNHITCIVGALTDGTGWKLTHEILLVISLYFQNDLSSLTLLAPIVWDLEKYAQHYPITIL